jgi:hypothetical protein
MNLIPERKKNIISQKGAVDELRMLNLFICQNRLDKLDLNRKPVPQATF